jgi:ribosomal protein S18 acetylase RimI-like enzyme
VLAATGFDPYARNTVQPLDTHGWQRADSVAWVGIDAEERIPYVSVLGTPSHVADLLAEIAPVLPSGVPVTMPAAAVPELRPQLRYEGRYHWRFRTRTDPVPATAPNVVHELADGDQRVGELLGAVGGAFSAHPGDDAVRRWIGVEEDGRLLACAADTSRAAGIGHMGSVAVHPAARRRGLGRAVVAWLTNDLLNHGRDVVAVGVFVAETAAGGLYDSLGFRTEQEFRCGPLIGGTDGSQVSRVRRKP